jgi:hypothetical protein
METEGSLPHSQVPATCPYPKPDRSNSCPHILLPEDSYLLVHDATARKVVIYRSYCESHIFSAHILLLIIASFQNLGLKWSSSKMAERRYQKKVKSVLLDHILCDFSRSLHAVMVRYHSAGLVF